MTTLSNIGHFFKALGDKIHAALLEVFGKPALDKVESDIKRILSDDVRVIFLDAITAAQTLQVGQPFSGPATNAEKRSAAYGQIVSDLKGKGISLAENVVNLGIELCVDLLKAKQPA